jgi:hypothetical protein
MIYKYNMLIKIIIILVIICLLLCCINYFIQQNDVAHFLQTNAHFVQTNAHSVQTNAHSVQTNAHSVQTNAHSVQTNDNVQTFMGNHAGVKTINDESKTVAVKQMNLNPLSELYNMKNDPICDLLDKSYESQGVLIFRGPLGNIPYVSPKDGLGGNEVSIETNQNIIDIINWIGKHSEEYEGMRIMISWLWNSHKFTTDSLNKISNTLMVYRHYDLNNRYFKIPYDVDDYESFRGVDRYVEADGDVELENQLLGENYLFIHEKPDPKKYINIDLNIICLRYNLVIVIYHPNENKEPIRYIDPDVKLIKLNMIDQNAILTNQINGIEEVDKIAKEKIRRLSDLIIKESIQYNPMYAQPKQQLIQTRECRTIQFTMYQIFSIDMIMRKNMIGKNDVPYIYRINSVNSGDVLNNDLTKSNLAKKVLKMLDVI